MLESERRESPEEELKRADHLIYVSLKYTRTCDVMKNAIARLIAAYELAFEEYLQFLKEKRELEEVPGTAKEKFIIVKDRLGTQARKYLVLYNLLKKIDKAEYTAIEEFRKNVTLKTKAEKPILVKMHDLEEYLAATKEFANFIKHQQK